MSEYKKTGLEKYTQKKYGGNHRNMSEAEEKEILSGFEVKAEAGQVVITKEVKQRGDRGLKKIKRTLNP